MALDMSINVVFWMEFVVKAIAMGFVLHPVGRCMLTLSNPC